MLTISEDPSSGNLSIQFIIIIILILINAFFAASELAILSANKIKLKLLADNGNKKAKMVLNLQENDTKLLSTIQVGITLAGFFSSATAAVSLSEGFAKTLMSLNIPFAEQIALIVVTIILSYFTLVFGELFPKRLALRSPEKVAMTFVKPITVIKTLFRPIVFLLSASCELLVKILRLKPKDEEKVTEEEIKAIVSTGVTDGTIDSSEEDYINRVLTLDDLTAKDIMKHRVDVFMISLDEPLATIKRKIKEEKYTRIPVYEKSNDNIIGIINIKDIFFNLKSTYSLDDLKSIIRKPFYSTESIKIGKLLKELQNNNQQTAVIIDEFGYASGFVTLEDIIEEVVGSINDEYDEKENKINKINDHSYIVDASISIQDLKEIVDIEHKEYSSLAGFINYHLESIPTLNQEFVVEEYNIKITILEMTNNRVIKVKIEILT